MTSTMPIVIETRGLRKVFSAGRAPITALLDISFAVREGSFVSLVGPSGCGKSTILRLIVGIAVVRINVVTGAVAARPPDDRNVLAA